MNHSFNVEVAMEYGLEESILLENLAFWCNKNKANDKNFHDGFYWTYNSVKAFCELFPYLTKAKISSALKNLEDKGLIKTGNYNTSKYDHTLWYTVTKKGFSYFSISIYEFKKSNISESEISITDINTDINTDIKESANAPTPKKKRFEKPTLEEVTAYCKEKGYENVDPQYFLDYYESKGWKIGNSPMKNWQCAVNNWNKRDLKNQKESRPYGTSLCARNGTDRVTKEELENAPF